MTDTDSTTQVESAPWPVPVGTRLDLVTMMALHQTQKALAAIEGGLVALVKGRPVKRDEEEHSIYVHDLARVIDTLAQIEVSLAEVRAEADKAFCRALPMGTSAVSYADTRPMIPRFGGERKKWRNDLLEADVKPRLIFEPESGDKRTPEDAVSTTLSVVSLNGGNVKVTGLRKLGIDPDDYCHKEPKDPSVQVVG